AAGRNPARTPVEQEPPMAEAMKFTEDHLWVRIEGNRAHLGISEYGQVELGEVIAVELPDVGDEVEKGEPFGEIESVRTVSELLEIEVVLLETAELVAEPRVLFEQRERGSPEILALGAESDEVRDPVLADERRRRHRHAGEQQHHAQQPSTRHAHSAKVPNGK